MRTNAQYVAPDWFVNFLQMRVLSDDSDIYSAFSDLLDKFELQADELISMNRREPVMRRHLAQCIAIAFELLSIDLHPYISNTEILQFVRRAKYQTKQFDQRWKHIEKNIEKIGAHSTLNDLSQANDNSSNTGQAEYLSRFSEILSTCASQGLVGIYYYSQAEKDSTFKEIAEARVKRAERFILICGRLHNGMLGLPNGTGSVAWLEPKLKEKQNIDIEFLISNYWESEHGPYQQHPWIQNDPAFDDYKDGVFKTGRAQSAHLFALAASLASTTNNVNVTVGLLHNLPTPYELIATESSLLIEFHLTYKEVGTSLIFEFEYLPGKQCAYLKILSDWKYLLQSSCVPERQLEEILKEAPNTAVTEKSVIRATAAGALTFARSDIQPAFEKAGITLIR